MKWFEVAHSGPIRGSVTIPGAKNSSLALIAAAMMGESAVVLEDIPDIYDIRAIAQIGLPIGLRLFRDSSGALTVDGTAIGAAPRLDLALTSSFRASYYFVGALLARRGSVTLGYPGGDNFVDRPIDQHFKAFRSFGARIEQQRDSYTVSADKLSGAELYFDVITSGATMNAVMLGALAKGRSVLRNCARDPEVVDLCNLLNRMGARIRGAGTETITIVGVDGLSGCDYKAIPDRLVAAAFLMAAGVAGGTLELCNVIPEHLRSCLTKLREIGLTFEIGDQSLIVHSEGRIRATRVRTGMYPIFNSDIQQPMTSLLLKAPGTSIVTDKVFPHRFSHVPQLVKLGADIRLKNGSAFIRGGRPLRGGIVHAADVRAGTCLILAGMQAEGLTRITGIEHIERGYENAAALFAQAGIRLTKREGDLYGEAEAERGDHEAEDGIVPIA